MINKYSPEWLEIEKEVKHHLAKLLERLESPALDEAQTAYIRGQIKAFRTVLGLVETPQAKPINDNLEI